MFPLEFRFRSRWLGASALAAAVLVSAYVIRPGGTPATSGAQPTMTPTAAVSAEAVQRGDIQQTLSYSADIRSREQVNVMPKATGRVQQLLVDAGSQVKAGDALANLEKEDAQNQVAQARAALAGAEAKQATVEAGPRPEDVAAAQAAVDQQQVRLQDMQSGGRTEDILAARAVLQAQQAKLDLMLQGGRAQSIQQAQDAVDAATAKLVALQKGATDDIRQAAQSSVDSDKDALASAEAAYAALGGANAADLQAAQSQVETLTAQVQAAQSAVASADAALKNLRGTAPADIQQAQSAVDQAQAQLSAAQAALAQANNPTQAAIAQAQAALAQAQSQRAAAEANQTALEQNVAPPCADSINPATGGTIHKNSTACGEAKAAADTANQAANAAVESAQGQLDLLRRGGGPADKAQLTTAVQAAQASVAAARTRLDAVKSGTIDAERAQLQAQRDQAASQLAAGQQALTVAQARLAAITNGTLDAQVKRAQAQVTAATERLKSDQAHLEQIIKGATDEDMLQAEAAVDQARQQLALATQPNTQQEIDAQRAAVQQAQQQLMKAQQPYTNYDLRQQQDALDQAQALLAFKQRPYTDQDLAAAQSGVDQARAQVDQAELALGNTTVVAPVDGVISERLVAPGALVNPQTPLVTLVPPDLEIDVDVEQIHVSHVDKGQVIQIQVDAYPGQTFAGTIFSISPTVDVRSRTATVRIRPEHTTHQLRAGMFAHVNIVSAEHQGTLLIPKQALQQAGEGSSPTVFALGDGSLVQKVPVAVGVQSDRFVEVLSGLQEGQLVVTSGLSTLSNGEKVSAAVANNPVALTP
jgi:RND family efflux transporter MFP subunit